MIYNDLTRRHFEIAAAAGELSGPGVRRGAAGSRSQGTWVQFDVQSVRQGPQAIVAAVRFLAFGCPHVIAVCDWIAHCAVGQEPQPALPETVELLQRRFAMPVEKRGKILIVEDAWIAALAPPHGLG